MITSQSKCYDRIETTGPNYARRLMKLTSDRSTLHTSLQQLGRVVPSRSTLPILSSVLLSTEGGKLSIRATDLEISQVINLEASIDGEGSVAVPHRTLLDITNEMPEGELQIEVMEDRRINISTTFGNYSLMGKPTEEFPALPVIEGHHSVPISAGLLASVISKTSFAVSRDELKPSLMGVLFRFTDSGLRAVATDGHRLVRFNKSDFDSGDYHGENIIPVKFLNILGTYLTGEEEVTLNIGENHIMVQSQDTDLYTRIIEERFPDYESVFPQDNDKKVKLSREELLATVRRVSIFSNKTTHQIAFRLDQDGLEVSTEDIETVSNAREKLSCEYEGDPLLIGYNSNYLRDILMHLDGDRLIGEFKTAVSAAIFYHEQTQENEELTMLLMPIRLND